MRRARDQKYVDLVFDHYGRKCACCGEDEILFLTLDHIYNDGAEHRRAIGPYWSKKGHAGTAFYRWVVRNNYPDFLQALCSNCNTGKHRNGGECPHKKQTPTAEDGEGPQPEQVPSLANQCLQKNLKQGNEKVKMTKLIIEKPNSTTAKSRYIGGRY